jgi:hypothetical protein
MARKAIKVSTLEILNKIKKWQAFLIISTIASAVFFSGLVGGFQGDDHYQIVNNNAIHSLSNVGELFAGSTFWNGETLVGTFYRPIMSLTYAAIYSFNGANPILFHITQMMIMLCASFVLFLFLKNFFKPITALAITLIFLVHPINSQSVFAIPSMQEPLFMLFGLLSLWVLARGNETKNYVLAAVFLLCSLLSKETGIVFVALAVLYVVLFKSIGLRTFLKFLIPTVILYAIMRFGAIGIHPAGVQPAPIGQLDFIGRMFTLPSILVLYLSKIVFPAQLATSYYWIYPNPSFQTFFLPLIILVILVVILLVFGYKIYKQKMTSRLKLYVFFVAWAVLGLLPYMQIIPLDVTAVETWVFAALPGMLAVAVVIVGTYIHKLKIKYVLLLLAVLLIIVLGVRTAVRGMDYKNQETLSRKDIQNSQNNFFALNNYAQSLIQQNNFSSAQSYAVQSIALFPTVTNYTNLGVAQQKSGNFEGAKISYKKGLTYGSLAETYENLAIVSLIVDEPKTTVITIQYALKMFPRSSRLWSYLSFAYAQESNQQGATEAITKAAQLGDVSKSLYYVVTSGKRFDIPLPYTDKTIHLY